MPIIVTRNLTKKFKDLTAADNINLEINERECFGLLGPNGAGKTSLIRLITAVSPPNAGEIEIEGESLFTHAREIKAAFGVLPQIDNLDQDLPVLQNLLTFARYFDIPKNEAKQRAMEVLRLFELESKIKSNVRELSGGMRRRLLLARALINRPKILILDEPTTGLDPQARHLVWHKLAELRAQGVTELISTHDMNEASVICDRVAIMHQGKILSTGAPSQLVKEYTGGDVWEIDIDSEDRDKILREISNRELEYEDNLDNILVFNVRNERLISGITASPLHLKHRAATLEDVFLKLTGKTLNE